VIRACRGFFSKISGCDRKFLIRRPARLIRRIRRRGRVPAGDLRASFLNENNGEQLYRRNDRNEDVLQSYTFLEIIVRYVCTHIIIYLMILTLEKKRKFTLKKSLNIDRHLFDLKFNKNVGRSHSIFYFM